MITVRPALPGEPSHNLQRAGEIVRDAYLLLPDYPPDPEYDVLLERVADRLAHGTVLLAFDGDVVVGCLTFVTEHGSEYDDVGDPGGAIIRMFGVDRTRQGQGIGASMLEWCIDTARSMGKARVWLHTIEQMVAAIRLYERRGFARVPEHDLPFDGAVGLAYVLDL